MRKLTTFHYVDIHSHILYGVDDGPDNIETSIEMMKIAYDEGIRKIVATPHYHPGKCTMGYDFREKIISKYEGHIPCR